jgi:hypothetical protein
MKPFKISKDSWHFNLATQYGFLGAHDFDRYEESSNPDFCKYVQSVIAGFALVVGIITVISAVLAMLVLVPILNLIVYFQYDYVADLELMIFTGVIYAVFIWLVIYFNEGAVENRRKARYEKYRREKFSEPPELSFSQLCYKKFKEKTCFEIEVV